MYKAIARKWWAACGKPVVLPGGVLAGLVTLLSFTSGAQNYEVLHHFTGDPDGSIGSPGLVLEGSTLYGTTLGGGILGVGSVFKVNTDGTGYQLLLDGSAPPLVGISGGLVLRDGVLYGTAMGAYEAGGVVFKGNTNGTGFAWLCQFDDIWSPGWDGRHPVDGLVFRAGALYGVAWAGGFTSYAHPEGCGTVFKVDGGLDALHTFDASGKDGIAPRGRLALSGDTLYGVTTLAGSEGAGTIFKLFRTNAPQFAVIKHVSETVTGGLAVSGETLYGTTDTKIFRIQTDGSDYRVLKSFSAPGRRLQGELALCGETLYGTTATGGGAGHGTVYRIKTDGTGFRVLKEFTGTDGSDPCGGLLLADNVLYGTTRQGGVSDKGVVFRLTLPPELVNPACEGADFLFWFQTEAGESYTVEYNLDLNGGSWQFHQSVTGDGSLMRCCIPRTNIACSFRVRQP